MASGTEGPSESALRSRGLGAGGFYFADPGTAMMLRVGIGRGMGPAGLRVVGAVREARGLLAGEATGGNAGNPGWAARANVPRVGL